MRLPWRFRKGLPFTKWGLLNDEKYFFINSAFLVEFFTWLGVYPDIGPLWLRLLKKFIGFIAMFYSISCCFSSGYPLYQFKGDLYDLGDYLFLTLISFHSLISQIVLRMNEKRICHLLRAMEENLLAWPVRKPEDYLPPKSANKVRQNPEQPMESKPHPGEYILTHFILKTNWLITVFSSSCLLIASFFGLNPFFIKNPPGVRLLPHKGYFLVDETISPWYEIVYIWIFFGGWVLCLYGALIDIMIYTFIRYTAMHYQAIRLRLESLLETNAKQYNIQEQLIKCVNHHRKLIKFAHYNEETFNFYYLFVYLYTLLCITFLLLKIALTKEYNVESLLTGLILIILILNLYVLCHFCEDVSRESIMLVNSLYQVDWINMSRDTKKLLIIFYFGIQKPYYFTTGKFSKISLNMWLGVIRTGYSFFTLIFQIIE